MRRMKRLSKKGFTLIEMIVVIVIIAILAAIAVPAIMKYVDDARDTKYITAARGVYSDVQAYTVDTIKKYGNDSEKSIQYTKCYSNTVSSHNLRDYINATFTCVADADYNGFTVVEMSATFGSTLEQLESIMMVLESGNNQYATVIIQANGEVEVRR